MSSTIRVTGVVASVTAVFDKLLENLGVEHVTGAYDEHTVVIGIKYHDMARLLLQDFDLSVWKHKIVDGKLFVMKKTQESAEEIAKANATIANKIRKMGINAEAYLTSDNEGVIVVSLDDLIFKILEEVIRKGKEKLGGRMRTLRVKMGKTEEWSYIVLYQKERPPKEERLTPEDLEDLAV